MVTRTATPQNGPWQAEMPAWAVLLMDRKFGPTWRAQTVSARRMARTVDVVVDGTTVRLNRRSF